MEVLDDCLLADIVAAQDLGDPLDTRATEVNRRPRLAGDHVMRQCIGCQATCKLLEAAGEAPKYVGLAEEQLKIACPDYHLDDIA
ncbi:MAG: hypothetical protein ACHQT5_00910 [Candidatus Saccharimonadales bacterium]|jgi:hypothetical protein